MKQGDVIKLKAGATYYNGKSIPSWVFSSTLYYRGENSNGVVFSTQKTGAVTGTVNPSMIVGATSTPTATDNSALGVALKKCVSDIQNLSSFKELSKLL